MPIEIITQEQKKQDTALAIVAREREVYHYQVNIDNYTAILSALPAELPEELQQFANINPEQIADQVPAEHIVTVSNYFQRKKIDRLLKTEIIEQSKAKQVLDVMVASMDANDLETRITAILAAEANS